MFDAALESLEAIADSFPLEAVAIVAVLVGAGGMILTGWRYLVDGILGFFGAFNGIVGAIGTFFQALFSAFGNTIGGLIILIMGGLAVWWVLVSLMG